MVAIAKPPYIPIETYFELEDSAEFKSEFHDGVIVAMAGASPAHIRITTNLTRLIGNQLDGKQCEPFDSDMRVSVEECNVVYYPDLTVTCEAPRFANTRRATLLNPTLIIEVLSPSTERADRGIKFDCCRTIESLNAYVLVYQDEPRIDLYTRQPDGAWRYETAKGSEATLWLEAVGCELRLADVYARVEFKASAAPEVAE
jgi:Uma2 family endonuclease